MRGLDVLCKANVIRDNTDAVSLDNGLFSSIPKIEGYIARLNKTALQEGHKLGFQLEKINFVEESLGPENVRYLLVEYDVDGLGEIVYSVMKSTPGFITEKPNVNFYAFYHPEVTVRALDGEEVPFMPKGRAYTNGDKSIVEFNIALPSEELLSNIARDLTFFAISNHAISTPNLRVVNDYHRWIFMNGHRHGLSQAANALEKRLIGLESVFEELSTKLEEKGSDFLGKIESFIKRVESVPRRLIGD
jgi:hypothetical protein